MNKTHSPKSQAPKLYTSENTNSAKLKSPIYHLHRCTKEATCTSKPYSIVHASPVSSSTISEVVVSASIDGVIKFWKKSFHGIEFVKSFKAHVGTVSSISISSNGQKVISCSTQDGTIKLYDAINYDIMTMKKVTEFQPNIVEFLNIESLDTIIAVSEYDKPLIYIFNVEKSELMDAKSSALMILSMHCGTVTAMKCNYTYNTIISCDKSGMIEYWDTTTYKLPTKVINFECKSLTDLYTLAKVYPELE